MSARARSSRGAFPGGRSVRRELGLLLVVLAVPLLLLLAWSGRREYQLLRDKANTRTLSLADGAATSVQQFFAGAEGLMMGLARRYPEELLEAEGCLDVLTPMNEIFPFVVNLLVARPDGSLVCTVEESGDGNRPVETVAARDWFRAVLEDPDYHLGDPQFGAITRRWVVALGAPLLAPDGSLVGVLGGSVELRTLQDLLVGVELSEDDLVTIATEDDVVVARSEDRDRWIGTVLPGRRNPEVEVSEGRTLATGTDLLGVERSWASVRIPGVGWWVHAGVPEASVWGPLRDYALRNALISLLVILLALLMAAAISRNLADSLTRLVEGVRRASRTGAVPVPERAPSEVVELARQFDAAIAEGREMEERLRQSQKMEAVGRLAGGVAHDFNNLLTVIQGNVEMLLKRLPPGVPGRDEANQIAGAASRAAAVTGQLLTFSRRDRAQPRPVSLTELARGMESMLGRLVPEDVRWEPDVADESLAVVADPGHVEQVVVNLVLNARDAVGGGGHVRLRVGRSDPPPGAGDDAAGSTGWALVEVADDGPGMDEATRERIFEPFFTTKPRGRGTGLGLATVFGIVDQMGWVIRVESAPGEGAIFRVWIPLVPGGVAPVRGPEPEAPDRRPAGGEGRTVLLVEDEAALRSVMAQVLARAGYRVLTAEHGREGLERAAAHPGTIDVVVTDVVMPEMSGPAMAEQLALERPGVPVLFTTGYSDDPRIMEIAAADPDRVLPKPFRSQELLDRLARILGARPSAGG